jgi:NAD(P)-dependent dehydrogenase (short-subunit alcohol dehydrogenase family)
MEQGRFAMGLKGSPIFVTGGAGFIGSAVIRFLIDHTDAFIVNIDNLTYASSLQSIPQATEARYVLAKQNICNATATRTLFDLYKPRAVMHLAAESHVDRSIDGPAEFIQTNIVGTFTLLEEALRYWRSLPPQARASFRFCTFRPTKSLVRSAQRSFSQKRALTCRLRHIRRARRRQIIWCELGLTFADLPSCRGQHQPQ